MLRLAVCLAAGLVFPLVLAAQEKHTLKFKKPLAVGDRELSVSTDHTVQEAVLRNKKKEEVPWRPAETTHEAEEFEQHILAVDGDRRVTKLSRTYKRVSGLKDGKSADIGLDGKTVVIEWQGDAFQFTYASGDAVTGPQRAWLERHFKSKAGNDDDLVDKAFTPARP